MGINNTLILIRKSHSCKKSACVSQRGLTCVPIDVDGHTAEDTGRLSILLSLDGGVLLKLLLKL